jgi:hypothetical protein
LTSGTLEKVHDIEFEETNGLQDKDEERHSIDKCNEENGHW